jgi:surface polysaccharide O-acyltransferase-like enzyme
MWACTTTWGVLDAIDSGALKFIVMFLRVICQPGTNIFVIISGYFLIESQFKIKKLLVLWTQVLFFSVSLFSILCALGYEQFSLKSLIESCLPCSFNQYWFIRVYLYMYMCVPFLNILLRNLNQKCHLSLIGLGVILMVIPASIPGISVFNDAGSNGVLWFFMLYAVNAF